jgi:NADPH:quinone reductase-like Zn-dependent oxidoreductase
MIQSTGYENIHSLCNLENMIMKAAIYTKYGAPDVLHLEEIEKPVPQDNEILVKIQATTVNYGDLLARNFSNLSLREFNMPTPLWLPVRLSFGWSKPKNPILGSEFAGVVEGVGKDVTRFKPGDQVFGYLGQNMGAYAAYCCVREDGLVALTPANMRSEEAATLPYGVIMAVSILEKARLQPGQRVLINGASGAIGAAAVQLAKYYGAEVTGVCGTPRVEFVQALGADKVIDYTKEDFTQNGETYDLIFDVLGRSSFSRCKQVLAADGTYLLVSFKTRQLLQMLWTSIRGSKQKVICAFASENAESLDFVRELVEAGQYRTVIDRCFPMEEAAEAHRYVEAGHKRGNVVIVMENA